ncbi:hypothetical protein G6F68_018029 [Rhizopus microsporus]|nr:hypothetical protein G6F68_018029 [Rhizopus microsporus]
MLARDLTVSILDTDTDAIRAAAKWGVKVYYGDGTRIDMLRRESHGQVDQVRVPAGPGGGARVRPDPFPGARQGRRGLPGARDPGIRPGVRRSRATGHWRPA